MKFSVPTTIHISLSYLGQKDVQDRYVEMLLDDYDVDNLNRGFHLEYYGDIDYNSVDPLLLEDPLGPYKKTYWKLYNRLGSSQSNPLSDIETHTLLSLIQHRLVSRNGGGVIDKNTKDKTIQLITSLLKKGKVKNALLKNYCQSMLQMLEIPNFTQGRIITNIYGLKREERMGWKKESRKCNFRESVAEHIFGCLCLANILPTKPLDDEDDYSQKHVKKLLEFHDYGEALTGDIARGNKGDKDKAEELKAVQYLSVYGAFNRFGSLKAIHSLFVEFESNQTLNAKVAQDVDLLENYVQLLECTRSKIPINEINKWANDLLIEIKTNYGHYLLELIQQEYKSEIAQIEKSIARN